MPFIDPIFSEIVKEAYQKCFGEQMTQVVSESAARHWSNEILEATGLVIGAKSLKNYSSYVLGLTTKSENPSLATLDTLARYVAGAPSTDEQLRRKNESHYPYWFSYQASKNPASVAQHSTTGHTGRNRILLILVGGLFVVVLLVTILLLKSPKKAETFEEDFSDVTDAALVERGWVLKQRNPYWWNKRDSVDDGLLLFTLPGDNWADAHGTPQIDNLLLRELPSPCFSIEVHMSDFIPRHRWQQAGILLLADTSLQSESVRLSLVFNDEFGGFDLPAEVLVQAAHFGKGDAAHPEELLHHTLFQKTPETDTLVDKNLRRTALRIEKRGDQLRFLFAAFSSDNYGFREAGSKTLSFAPRYIALFAMKGNIESSPVVPVHVRSFRMQSLPCENAD